MKKFVAALSIFLMLGGIAIAGGCDNHNKFYSMVKNVAEALKVIFLLSMNSKDLVKCDINLGQIAYNVESEMR